MRQATTQSWRWTGASSARVRSTRTGCAARRGSRPLSRGTLVERACRTRSGQASDAAGERGCALALPPSVPESLPQASNLVRRCTGNAKGNTASAECSPTRRRHAASRTAAVPHLSRRRAAFIPWWQQDLQQMPTGGGVCRPPPRLASATRPKAQPGRERPPSETRHPPVA